MIEFILYVHDQELSSKFYSAVLRKTPVLNVPGMTEFLLTENCKLGLMSVKSITTILNGKTLDPDLGRDIPRCELYIHVDDIEFEYDNAIKSGATIISEIKIRSWGDVVC